jgi:hypothetical protein
MTETQRTLARHALGFPNKKNESNRNHFCTGPGSDDFDHWEDLWNQGLATKRSNGPWGNHMFYLTLKGALLACLPKEHLVGGPEGFDPVTHLHLTRGAAPEEEEG